LKFKITCFFIFLWACKSLGQVNNNLRKIDSIQRSVLKSSIQDSITIANANYQIGELYRYAFFADSAYTYYHKAEKIFRSLGDTYQTALTLYGIAVIQKNEKDFTGSEVSSIEALSLLDELEESNDVRKYKAYIYNNLGLVFGQLEQYDESISYYLKAITLKEKLEGDNKVTINSSKNNLALSYKNAGMYDLALKYYNEILNDKIFIKDRADIYAIVLDNYAHTLYLANDKKQLPGLYLKALKICDSIDAQYNSIIINQHLAEYYHEVKKSVSAKYYAYRAIEVAEQYPNDDLLKSLLILSKIEDDSMAVKYYNQ